MAKERIRGLGDMPRETFKTEVQRERKRKDNRICKNWYHYKIGIPERQERTESTRWKGQTMNHRARKLTEVQEG